VSALVDLGGAPHRMVAAVGPCIARDSYEVGVDFMAQFLARDPAYGQFFSPGAAPEKRQFDLPRFVLFRLASAGVESSEWIGHDTCAEEETFFSNRRAFRRGEADYGRLLSAIVLEGAHADRHCETS
jgi:copper oxidase (laccase) domain-containing protein